MEEEFTRRKRDGEYQYVAHVVGRLWSGPRGTYQYSFSAPSDEEAAKLVKRVAGDFETVEDFHLDVATTCPCCGSTHWKTARGWENPDSEEYFVLARS